MYRLPALLIGMVILPTSVSAVPPKLDIDTRAAVAQQEPYASNQVEKQATAQRSMFREHARLASTAAPSSARKVPPVPSVAATGLLAMADNIVRR